MHVPLGMDTCKQVWYQELKQTTRWYQYIRLCSTVGFLAVVTCVLFCGRGVGEYQITWGILEVISLKNHFVKSNFKVHYDLLTKMCFLLFADMVVPFCDKLNSAVNLLHCLAAWIHPVYTRTCAAFLWVLYLNLQYWLLFLYFTLPLLLEL